MVGNVSKAGSNKKEKQGWFSRLFMGTYGHNGPGFFEFLKENDINKRLASKIQKEMRRDGLWKD